MEDNLTAAAVLAIDYDAGQRVASHVHDVAQLVYATSGVLRTTTADAVFVLPPQRALLVAAGVVHRHDIAAAASMRTLYRSSWSGLGDGCRLLAVSRLAAELIQAVVAGRYDPEHSDAYLAVLQDQLHDAPRLALDLPLSDDPIVAPVADRLLADPSDAAGPSEWGRRIGASGRTVTRRFRVRTGLSFDQWRRRARVLRAMELRAQGQTLDACAHAVGYATASAFANAFKTVTGLTTSSIIDVQHDQPDGNAPIPRHRDTDGDPRRLAVLDADSEHSALAQMFLPTSSRRVA